MKLLKNRTVLGVLCIAVSLLICFAVTPLVNAGLSQKTTIVRFVKDVKACSSGCILKRRSNRYKA